MASGIDILQEVLRERLEEKEAKVAGLKNAQPMTRETENGLEKWCPKCKDYHPANEEHFYKDGRSKTGLSSWCRKAQNASVGKKSQKSKPVKGNGELTLVLDFSQADLLLADIKAEAGTDFRTPEMQAMWLISQALHTKREVGSEQL